MHPILFRLPIPGLGTVPIYSYGVMLGLSFVVGWYLTLGLSERDRLPKETMANCYVVTALSAVVMARVLYVLTNLHEFQSFGDVFALRSGGMVAYGGFLGGFLGSWLYLRAKGIPLIPWADVAVPSLASGLFITRIGCYLYGCDFGRPLAETAPGWLKRMGTFPQWAEGTLEQGAGSPAWAQHVKSQLIDVSASASLPVHPTQVYESAIGLSLLVFLLVARRHQLFRGQIFLYFTFFYGFARFCLELIRDDAERGDLPPALPPHVLVPVSLALFGAAWAFGLAPILRRGAARLLSQVLAFLPAVWAFVALKPAAFATVVDAKLSTSQAIGLSTALAAGLAFRALHGAARDNPAAAMAMPALPGVDEAEGDEEPAPKPKDEEEDAPVVKKPAVKRAASPKKRAGTAKRSAEERERDGRQAESADEET